MKVGLSYIQQVFWGALLRVILVVVPTYHYVGIKNKFSLCIMKKHVDRSVVNDENLQWLNSILSRQQALVEGSEFYKKSIAVFDNSQKYRIRCLAIGSPSAESAARNQLAYLNCLTGYLNIAPEEISIYDPVFNEMDKHFLVQKLGYLIAEAYTEGESEAYVIYFLPHVPILLLEKILEKYQPRFLISNDIQKHAGKKGIRELIEKYPNIAKVSFGIKEKEEKQEEYEDLRGNASTSDASNGGVQDGSINKQDKEGFSPVVKKKNRNKKGQAWKYRQFMDAEQEFKSEFLNRIQESSDAFPFRKNFQKCQLVYRYDPKDVPVEFSTSFSDLAVHIIK